VLVPTPVPDAPVAPVAPPVNDVEPPSITHAAPLVAEPIAGLTEEPVSQPSTARVTINSSVLSLPQIENMRLCLDFGTAMSKATLVHDDEPEHIVVLELGKPGDQEQLSPVMLISSVYIDNEGLIWFGKSAVDRSQIEGNDGSRQRLDNIKRRLSEDGYNELVRTPTFAPDGVKVTYGEMIIAYLMFLTWATNRSLESLGYARNIRRRFAMPCFPGEKSRDVSHTLRKTLGEAQILADTFSDSMMSGIPVGDFVEAVKEVKAAKFDFPYMGEDITEPLGVAGALMSWRNRVDMLVMVVDVGAGTSDFSLYRVVVDPQRSENTALEISSSARGITEAGNYLDRVLIEFILKKADITFTDQDAVLTRGKLELNIRDYKETLFNEEFVFIALPNNKDVEIELDEFISLEAVKSFGKSLKDAMENILETVDESVVDWVHASPGRYLTIALTGGGATLPMVQDLAREPLTIRGRKVPVQAALPFPKWLEDEYSELEDDFARIAVSLGGARKRLVNRGAGATILGGDLQQPPKLGGYYLRGN
jgi:molecular chaperone HscA